MPDSYVKHTAHPSEPYLQLHSSSLYASLRLFWNPFPLPEHQGNLSVPSHCSARAGPFFSNTHAARARLPVMMLCRPQPGNGQQAALATCHRTWWQRKCMSYSLLANSVPWNSRLSSSLAPLSPLSPPVLKAGLIWAQVAEEDFNEMNSDSLLYAVIPQILRNPW